MFGIKTIFLLWIVSYSCNNAPQSSCQPLAYQSCTQVQLNRLVLLFQQGLVLLNLPSREVLKVTAFLNGAIPLDDPIEGLDQRQHWLPTKLGLRLGRVQFEVMSFPGMRRFITTPGSAIPP